jgi:hypothetical protein
MRANAKKKRWVQQLRIADRLRVTDRDKAIYCTISRIDSKQGETFGLTWSDGCKNTLSYFDADLFDEITLGGVCFAPNGGAKADMPEGQIADLHTASDAC